MTDKRHISPTTLKRLPRYLAVSKALAAEGWEYITSGDLARACDMQEILVRKDVLQTGVAGHKSHGYPVGEMISILTSVLGWDRPYRAVMIGSGHLAQTLMDFPVFVNQGVTFAFVADSDPARVGAEICGKPILPLVEAEKSIREEEIRLAVLAVSPEQAQPVADRLIAAGITAIMNFTPMTVIAPEGVTVSDADFTPSLAELTHSLSHA